MHNINHSERLPYEKLAALGIDREKAESLPQEVKEKLASGEVTPLMQVSISARNGDIITLPLKLQLTTDQQGNPALMAYPVRAVLEKEHNQVLRLTEQEAERLNKGEVIQKAVEVNGEKDPAVSATRSRNQINLPSQGYRRSAGTEAQGHGKGQRHRTGHAAKAAGTRGKTH